MNISIEEFDAEYAAQLIQFAKDNPDITPGMSVAVYDDDERRQFMGYGRVIETEWSNEDLTWIASVQFFGKPKIYYSLMATRMRRIRLKPSQLACVMRRVK